MNRTRNTLLSIIKSPLLWISLFCLFLEFLKSSPTSLFGQAFNQDSITLLFSLNLNSPLENFGIPLLLSHFVHISIGHLFFNLLSFLIVAYAMEYRSRREFYLRILGMGLAINVLLVGLTKLLGLDQGRVLGLSSLIFAMATYSILTNPRKNAWLILPAFLSLWLMPQASTSITFLGHAMGSGVGIIASNWKTKQKKS